MPVTALENESLPPGPYPLFEKWHRAAEAQAGIPYAGAMTLSTVSADGFPEGRVVLLHAAEAGRGFAFLTDARSRKGRALAKVPRAALTFYWGPLERQVRVQGRVACASSATADRFFARRPRRSRAVAWAATQSRPLPSGPATDALKERVAALDERFSERATIPRPPYWQAYWVRPRCVAFWEAKARRLHTRVRYDRDEKSSAGWRVCRPAP
ncbi:MAG: pyridoxamine 5'-phosphate oxidase [Bacteroidetes bacterium QS_9_68_14]|nr:MAG: pyridoxamine 5'-phosphate oxidase [Bacteroidetes bacterium QS_9_68_14]